MAVPQRNIRERVVELVGKRSFRRQPLRVLARALMWAFHCMLKIPAKAFFERWQFTLFLPPRWHGGGSTAPFIFREDYEPDLALLERFLKPGMVCVDGGANTGVFTFTAARLVGPSGRVLSFEPGKSCFTALQKSSDLNGFQNIVLRNEALADVTSMAPLYHHFGHENSFALGSGDAAGLAFDLVKTVTLDQVLEELKINHADVIKLDIEGAEELALRGARSLLARCQPIVMFELNPAACRRLHLKPEGAWDFLRPLGYQLFALQTDGNLEKLTSPRGFGNYWAVPPA